MKLTVVNVKKETDQAVTVSFKNNRFFNRVNYKPGQFLTLKIPINGRVESRAYSFSSDPYTEKTLKITVKKVKNGLVSNYLNTNVKAGQKVTVEKPMGSFYIEPNADQKLQYVLFAGGSGITPVFSILKTVLAKEPQSKVVLIYANLNIDNIIFLQELQDLCKTYPDRLSVEYILSENTNPLFHSGFVTQEILEKIFEKHELEFTDHKYMMCGPAGYMRTVKEILKTKSIAPSQIQTEVFKAAKIKIDSKNLLSKVTIKHKGTTHNLEVPGNRTILEQAMKENIALPYSCRSGMCSTCKAQCTSGDVQLTKGHILPDDEVANGAILTCVSYPTSEEVTIEIPK
jgi:ring-1,2-phenylacetyl-CoA epoxidase subunit PaaE